MDIKELLDNARRNETLLKRLQAFELQLLSCQNFGDLLTLLFEGLPSQFDLDAIGLRLYDPNEQLKTSMLLSLDVEQGDLLNQIQFQAQISATSVRPIVDPSPWNSGLSLPLVRNNQEMGQLHLYSSRSERFLNDMATDFLQHLAAVIAACLVMVRHIEEHARLALTDPLTAAENRRGFERAFNREWARGLRQYHSFALVLLDLDFFKQVNDVHGHGTGDRVLSTLCRTLRQLLRPTDHIGRLGGEEFAILIPGCECDQLGQIVGRIQNAIRTMHVRNDKNELVPITASGSFVCLIPRPQKKVTLAEAMDHLDIYLYEAKKRGRNCFVSGQ